MPLDYLVFQRESSLRRSQRAARDYALHTAARERRQAERQSRQPVPRPSRVRAVLKKVLA